MLYHATKGMDDVPQTLDEFMHYVVAKSTAQYEFHQAVREVTESVWPLLESDPVYLRAKIPERMVHAERIIIFRVPWVDDAGEVQVNRGFRVEMNSAIGTLQGRPAIPSVRQPRHPEVPRIRAGVQERADNPSVGWGQRRSRLRSPRGGVTRRSCVSASRS